MPKHDVFLSYPHDDVNYAWVTEFVERLRQYGVTVWLDTEEIQPGDFIGDAIEDGLRNSDLIVVILGQEGARSPGFFFELGAAVGMGKRVIPIVPGDIDPGKLPGPIRSKLPLRRQSPSETADELYRAITPSAPAKQ
jgi:hypothetical protein